MNQEKDIKVISKEIKDLQKKLKKFEQLHAWEESITRRIVISFMTYFIVALFFYILDLGKPFINAIIPTLGFVLSHFSLRVFKKLWIKKYKIK